MPISRWPFPGVPKDLRGTYAGMAHPAIIEHLTSLGVTAVELMPVYQFVNDPVLGLILDLPAAAGEIEPLPLEGPNEVMVLTERFNAMAHELASTRHEAEPAMTCQPTRSMEAKSTCSR